MKLEMLPYKNINIKTNKILEQLTLSSRALAELKGYANTIPNMHILINAVTINEAKKPYIHGLADKQVAEINFDENEEMSEDAIQVTKDENIENEYELYSEFDIEKYFELKS